MEKAQDSPLQRKSPDKLVSLTFGILCNLETEPKCLIFVRCGCRKLDTGPQRTLCLEQGENWKRFSIFLAEETS